MKANYEHTQFSPFSWTIPVIGLAMTLTGLLVIGRHSLIAAWAVGLGGLVMTVIGLGTLWLRIRVSDMTLSVRFGPLPMFRRAIPLGNVTAAQQARSRFIDGWGIHWAPGRGWTWNLWGFDCVELSLKNGTQWRLGTDDPEGLLKALGLPAHRPDEMAPQPEED